MKRGPSYVHITLSTLLHRECVHILLLKRSLLSSESERKWNKWSSDLIRNGTFVLSEKRCRFLLSTLGAVVSSTLYVVYIIEAYYRRRRKVRQTNLATKRNHNPNQMKSIFTQPKLHFSFPICLNIFPGVKRGRKR